MYTPKDFELGRIMADIVEIEESRPLSKLKRWSLVKINKKAANVAELPAQ